MNPRSQDMKELAEDTMRGGTFLFIGLLISNILNGITSIVIARLLGPVDFALYGMSLALPSILFSFANIGLDSAIIKYVSNLQEKGAYDEARRILRYSFYVRLSIAILFLGIGFAIAEPFAVYVLQRTGIVGFVQLATITVPFQAMFWYSYQGFKSINRMSWSGTVRSIHAVAKTSISIYLIWAGFSIFGAITGFVASYAIAGFVGILILWKLTKKEDSTEVSSSQVSMKKVIQFGLTIYLVILITDAVIQYRLIVLANIFTDELIGNFNAAANISIIILGFSTALIAVLFPAFSRLSAKLKPSEMSDSFNLALKYVTLAVIPIAFLIIALSDEISIVFYGPEYTTTPALLRLLSLVSLLVILGAGVLESFLSGVGKPQYATAIWAAYLILFIPLAPILSILLGIEGIIVAQLLARGISCLIGLLIGHYILKMKYDLKLSIPILGAALIAFLPVFYLDTAIIVNDITKLVIGGAFFGLIYITLLPLFKVINENDLRLIERSFATLPIIRIFVRVFLFYESALLRIMHRKTNR